MVNEPRDFYLLDGKLLYACSSFIGFNPVISKPLTHEPTKGFGTKVTVDEFDLLGSSFTVILTNFMGSGPLRGYKRIEVLKEGRTIIRYENGGKGFGSVYGEGNYFLVKNSDAYLVADGSILKDKQLDKIYPDISAGHYYFFWFKDVIVPTVEEIVIDYDSVEEKESYVIKEINHLRQIEWHAKATINNHDISISKSSIPGFSRIHRNSPGYEKFRKAKAVDMSETVFIVDGVDQLAE